MQRTKHSGFSLLKSDFEYTLAQIKTAQRELADIHDSLNIHAYAMNSIINNILVKNYNVKTVETDALILSETELSIQFSLPEVDDEVFYQDRLAMQKFIGDVREKSN